MSNLKLDKEWPKLIRQSIGKTKFTFKITLILRTLLRLNLRNTQQVHLR